MTDTIAIPENKQFSKLKVLSIAPIFAKAISLIYHNRSVDSLFNNNDKQRAFENADLIIDASTSIAVERNLALDNSYGDARRSSVFLNPKGTELVLLYEDTERKYRLDLLEMTYYRMLIVDERLMIICQFQKNKEQTASVVGQNLQ